VFRVGTIAGIGVYWHVSSVLGLFVFSGFRIAPWAWLAFVALVLVHELGHALLVRWRGHRVVGIHLTAWGGECQWRPGRRGGEPSNADRVIIAWGGVLAQSVVLVVAISLVALGVRHPVLSPLVWSNAIMIFFNLMPIPPLDGATAWRLDQLRAPPAVRKLMKDLKKKLR
jgi:Zn-dependent protease